MKGKITLPEVDREYTLYKIAISMSAGLACALGLTHKGNLGIGCDADLVALSWMAFDHVFRWKRHRQVMLKVVTNPHVWLIDCVMLDVGHPRR